MFARLFENSARRGKTKIYTLKDFFVKTSQPKMLEKSTFARFSGIGGTVLEKRAISASFEAQPLEIISLNVPTPLDFSISSRDNVVVF